jgi:DNA-binding MarR family transcriptional regulator
MTGILDRLERAHWIVRERDPKDRRAVVVRIDRDRYGELLRLYGGMSRSMNKILSDYADSELELIADFMGRVVDAGRDAAKQLADQAAE